MSTLPSTATMALLLLVACGSPAVEQTGRYHLDTGHFAPAHADALIAAGRAPASARAAMVAQLRSARFDLELRSDGSFRAEEVILGQGHQFRGTWRAEGPNFRLEQSHQDGKPVEGVMTGTWVAGRLTLAQRVLAGERTLVLRHETAPAVPPR